MKSDRWRQLDSVFQSALERAAADRPAFLDEVCAGDDALRREVEALLAAHVRADSFIEGSALETEARLLAKENHDSPTTSLLGKTISHYRIIAPLGSGGMGEVYLAQDTRLRRKIALKILPDVLTLDEEHLQRFELEAHAASALNHPNIVTIHEVGQDGPYRFIAEELIEGITLSQHSAGRPLAPSEALDIAMQVSSALASAHAKGIVHRDIKPGNIMLDRSDYVLGRKQNHIKVVDFGIAKLAELPTGVNVEATTWLLVKTAQGRTIGTAPYMSPEQARGESVDARTDIWSLGVVLYEMLTAEQPFTGSTSQDVLASILRDDLPPLPSESPEGLRWILKKALRKDRDERYQTVRELFSDLRDLHEQLLGTQSEIGHPVPPTPATEQIGQTKEASTPESASTTTETSARLTSSAEYIAGEIKRLGGGVIVILALLIVAVAGITFGLYKLITRNQRLTNGQNQVKSVLPFQRMKLSRLTSTGKATQAAISPDGKYVVHVVDDGQQQSLWMRQVSTSSNVQINPPADVTYFGLTFSPGGDYLYYNAWDKKTPFSLFQMPALGGAAKRLVTDIDSVVTFSPDGKQFAFLRGYPTQGELALLVANADGTSERKVATGGIPAGPSIGDPSWSPDGKVIAYPSLSTHSGGKTILQVQVADGSTKPIGLQAWWEIERLAWLRDGSGLVFTARESVASPSQIWYLSYPGGQAHRITNDLNDYLGVSLTADSAVLSTVRSEQVSNIWILPNEDTHRAGQITYSKVDGVEGISWTPDDKIVYASKASGKLDLWMMEANGTGQKQLTADAGNNRHPSVSPDGRYVVFISDRTGINHVWRIDIDGSNARQLTNGESEWDPKCSPIGQWVIYQSASAESGKGSLWKVSIDGGDAIQIIDKTSAGVAISPDGKWVASAHFEPTAIKTAIYPIEGGEPHKILDIFSFYVRWTPDGRALAYLDENSSNISSRSVDGGPLKPLTHFTSDRIFSFAWSRDGKQLALARGVLDKDVVLISNFNDQQ